MQVKRILSTLLALQLGLPAAAQIVRISGIPGADTARWDGNVELNFQANKSDESFFRLAAASLVRHRAGRSTWLSSNELRQTVAGDDDFENKGFQHFRYQRRMDSVLALEAFTQVQFDQVLRIRLRQLNGLGPRIQFLRKTQVFVFVGTLYMYEYEEEKGTGRINRDHRISTYFNLARKWQRFGIRFIAYYQPAITEWEDYRLSASGSFSLKLTHRLDFSVRGEYTFDAHPVEGVPDHTYDLLTGVSWRFR